MKVKDLKFYNFKNREVTDLILLNTDFAKDLITKRLEANLGYNELCEVFREVQEVFIKEVTFNRVEFKLGSNELSVLYTINSKPLTLVVTLKD